MPGAIKPSLQIKSSDTNRNNSEILAGLLKQGGYETWIKLDALLPLGSVRLEKRCSPILQERVKMLEENKKGENYEKDTFKEIFVPDRM